VALWVGVGSETGFANLKITPAKVTLTNHARENPLHDVIHTSYLAIRE
jgi:hypothetical protein